MPWCVWYSNPHWRWGTHEWHQLLWTWDFCFVWLCGSVRLLETDIHFWFYYTFIAYDSSFPRISNRICQQKLESRPFSIQFLNHLCLNFLKHSLQGFLNPSSVSPLLQTTSLLFSMISSWASVFFSSVLPEHDYSYLCPWFPPLQLI